MSAVWAPVPDGPDQRVASRGPSRLRAVQPPASRLSRAPFLLVLIGVFGLGMAGLLMLNTTLQNQAFSSRALDRQATELAYAQADLENQIDLVSAPPELARRASALGMRPNPYPAFLEMPSGTVVGKAQPVRGSEVPSLVVRTPAEVAAAKAAAEAKAKAKAAAAEKARKAAEAKAKAQEKAKAAAAAAKKAAAEQQTAADQKAKKADAKKAEAKKAETKKSQAGRG
jgi:hypothetical protein